MLIPCSEARRFSSSARGFRSITHGIQVAAGGLVNGRRASRRNVHQVASQGSEWLVGHHLSGRQPRNDRLDRRRHASVRYGHQRIAGNRLRVGDVGPERLQLIGCRAVSPAAGDCEKSSISMSGFSLDVRLFLRIKKMSRHRRSAMTSRKDLGHSVRSRRIPAGATGRRQP